MSLNEARQGQIMACVAKSINNRKNTKSLLLAVTIGIMIYPRKQMSSFTTYNAKNMCDSRELLMDKRQFINNVRLMPRL